MTSEIAVGKILLKKRLTLAVAESCTGGLISNRITDVAGSSGYFLCGIVAYSNGIKEKLLGVSGKSIGKYGAISKQVALEMAKGVRRIAKTDISISVTGIAGPTGGTKVKPVGLVYIGFAMNKKCIVKEFRFKGSRKKIKILASEAALNLICAHS